MKTLATAAIIIAIIIAGSLAYIYWPLNAECITSSDCVANKCCHATSCVSKANAPDCATSLCTAECKENTMDCGQGKCICDNGKCDVEWKND